jgi:hypothetical protein
MAQVGEKEPFLGEREPSSQKILMSTKEDWEDEFQSKPPPPFDLWDTDDLLYLDKVRCNAMLRVTGIDPKEGTFTLRLKCHWRFRTLNSGDRTETHLKVPGLRMPGLNVGVEESRIWRDLKKSTDKTLYWRGVSQFNIQGYEIFEMSDFPFDRQVINLELLEFVWKESKDADTFDYSMKLVYFRVSTESMLPEWDPYQSKVLVDQLITAGDREGPTCASRFKVSLRVERKIRFFIIQIYFVTLLIMVITCFPLALPPDATHVGTRLGAYGTGVLTLVAYKYGIADTLPRVPYQTYTDKYLSAQILTAVCIAIEALVMYHLVEHAGVDETNIRYLEMGILIVIVLLWIWFFTYTAKFKARKSWTEVFANQELNYQTDPNNHD